MATIILFNRQFTSDEKDAIERALVLLLEQVDMVGNRRRPVPMSGDDLQEAQRLYPYAQSALLKIELEQQHA